MAQRINCLCEIYDFNYGALWRCVSAAPHCTSKSCLGSLVGGGLVWWWEGQWQKKPSGPVAEQATCQRLRLEIPHKRSVPKIAGQETPWFCGGPQGLVRNRSFAVLYFN